MPQEQPVKVVKKLTSMDVEIAVATLFNYRMNVIVPNVSDGLGLNHECDLLIVTPARRATEIEIKVTASDIRSDKKKWHNHESGKIYRFFFAVPEYLKDCPDLPLDAGLIVVGGKYWDVAKVVRRPRYNKHARPLSQEEYLKLLHLGCMRIWSLKECLMGRCKDLEQLRRERNFLQKAPEIQV